MTTISVTAEFLLDDKFKNIRRREFGDKHGIYALYDKKGKLYYVGCSSSNLNARLNDHLKSEQHSGKWVQCVIYFTEKNRAKDMEKIVLNLLQGWVKPNKKEEVKPEGNQAVPTIKHNEKIQDRLDKVIHHKMFGNRTNKRINKTKNNKFILRSEKSKLRSLIDRKSSNLKELSPKMRILKKIVKKKRFLKLDRNGKTYHATLFPSMEFEYQGKKYSSPSSLAKAATSAKTENGWDVWKIQDKYNKWIPLNEFVKSVA